MKKTATELMKELKFLKSEASRLHSEDEDRSLAPVNDKLEFMYDTGYSYERNREEINKIFSQERKIKGILAKFNFETKLSNFDLTIEEALVRIGQIKSEINILSVLAKRTEYIESEMRGFIKEARIKKINYNQAKVFDDLYNLQGELSALQMEIDRINLTTLIEF